jgi:long-chain fatty acid transport protein
MMYSTEFEARGIASQGKIFCCKNLRLFRSKVWRVIESRRARRSHWSRAGWVFRAPPLIFLLLVLVLGIFPARVWGSGFTVYQQGTGAMAQGNAFVAEADDPSAIFYNPAGINQLKRPEVYLMGLVTYPDREFHGPGGQFSQTNHRFFPSGSAFAVFPFNKAVTAGIGFYAPFGIGSQWPPTWAGRYITTYSSLQTYNLNPVISIRPIQRFSLAVGLDVMWSSVELKRKVPVVLGRLQFPDAEARLRGDGNGFGINIGGLLWVVEGVKLGLSYRSQISTNINGNLDLTNLPQLIPGPRQVSAASNLTYPPFITGGISVSRFSPFTFNFDVTWTGWSTFQHIRVDLRQPILVNGVPSYNLIQPKNWRDAYTFRFGMNYQLTKTIKLRAGYTYDLSPIPDSTFDPLIPNANQHVFAVGGDWKIKQFTLGLAYIYVMGENRSKNNNVTLNGVPFPAQANGTYRSDAQALAISLSYHF